MKRIICSLLVFCLLLPALAFAAPSQKLQAIYDSVDTLNVEELVALQDYVNAKIDASSAINTDETTYVLNKNTKKFHYADCASAKSIKDKNRTTYTGVAARTPCHAARVSCHISKSAEYAKSRPFYATSGFLIYAVFYAVSGFGLSIISTFPSAR